MSTFDKIEGTLVYVQVDKPVKAFVKPGAPKKPDEWKASVVITDKAIKKDLEKYGKSLDTLLSIKEVDSSEFEEIYKCALPEGAGDEVWVVTLRKSTELGKTGKPVPDLYKPKVYHKVKNTRLDITNEKLVGNGSYGFISIDKFDRTAGGSSLYLKNILVTDLKEYVAQDSDYSAGSEFDDDAADDGDGGRVKVPAKAKAPEAKKTVAKPTPKPASGFDDMDDDIPF